MDHSGVPPPPAAPPAPPGHNEVELKVSKRVLWVGEAAYPLHNITRVHSFELKPKRWEAFTSFLKWLAATFVVLLLLALIVESADSGGSSYYGEREDNSLDGVIGFGAVVGIVLLLRLLVAWAVPTRHVLAVETASGSGAVVTLPNPEQLRGIVHSLVVAIDNPEAEFLVRVERLQVNPSNYHFGDTVNIQGGSFNTGIKK
ncbi:DUF6232 family protein [Streptomyces sp. YIM 98790]|uniref:DUF6232 family protein n=1 Tax=Streptomyces sp. YIM 98790 TaxID=2689077 RepID=UPI001FB56EBA|nr:DUF6232 family protein [Streptomyces sp. YIM 98790]